MNKVHQNDNFHSYLTFEPLLHQVIGELPKNFSGVAYSGELIKDYGFLGNVVIDLNTLHIPEKAFVLLNHDPNQRVGHCRFEVLTTAEGSKLMFYGQFFEHGDIAQQIAQECQQSAPWNMSVGIQAKVDFIGKSMMVNGREVTPDALLKDGRLLEVSFVPCGADPNTHVVSFNQEAVMNKEYEAVAANEEIELLKEQVQGLLNELEETKNQLFQVKRNNKIEKVKALLSKANIEYDEKIHIFYVESDDRILEALEHDLFKNKGFAIENNKLFEEFAKSSKGIESNNTLDELQRKLLNQVKGVK